MVSTLSPLNVAGNKLLFYQNRHKHGKFESPGAEEPT